MIKRLILTDFMAHGRTEIEFASGLTVLVGPNNSGKSAVVEALRCLTTSPPAGYAIRHGAKRARVEVEFADGHRVAWIRNRKPAYALYELWRPGADEPQTYAKFGNNTPEDVLAVLKLNSVAIEGQTSKEVDVHLGDQRAPVFLLDESGFTVASFFAASTESAYLLEMQRLLTRRERDEKNRLKAVEARQAQVAADLDRLADVPALTLDLERIGASLRLAQAQAARLPALERSLADLRRAEAAVRRGQALASALASLIEPPAPVPTARLAELAASLQAAGERARRRTAQAQALAALAAPPAPRATVPLAGRLQALRAAERLRQAAAARLEALAPLAAPPASRPVAPLAGLLAAMRDCLRAGQTAAAQARALSALAAPPAPRPCADLERLAGRLRQCDQARRTAERRLAALASLAPPPASERLAAPAALAALARQIRRTLTVGKATRARSDLLADLREPPAPVAVAPLAQLADALRRTLRQEAALAAAVEARQADLAAFEAQLAERLGQIGRCPLCHAELELARLTGSAE